MLKNHTKLAPDLIPAERRVTVEACVLLLVGVIRQLQSPAVARLHLLVRPPEHHRLLQLSGRVDGGIRPVAI